MTEIAVQDKYGPHGSCFGCGPTNEKGLRIKSFWENNELILRFTPEDHHSAFPGAINGGIIGSLFDCHQNWCAATTLYQNNPDTEFPSTVTSEFSVKLTRPTPSGKEILVKARIVDVKGPVVKTEAEMFVEGKLTAKSTGTFVQVKPGHPAYHRWD